MIAIATAASAAAIVIIKMVKKIPSRLPGYRYLLKATKLIFTLFNISSIAISIVIIFLLVKKPYIPMKNNAVLTNKMCVNGISVIFNQFSFFNGRSFYSRAFHGDYNTSNHCGKQEYTYYFKRQYITMICCAKHISSNIFYI